MKKNLINFIRNKSEAIMEWELNNLIKFAYKCVSFKFRAVFKLN